MITSKIIAKGILKSVSILVLIFVCLYFIVQIQTVIIYLIIALILTLIGNPIQYFFKKRLRFNNLFSTIATLLIFLCTIVGFILMFVPLINAQSKSLSVLNTIEIEKNAQLLLFQFSTYLENHNIDAQNLIQKLNLTSKINFNFIPIFLNAVLNTLSSFGIGLASVMFITFFFLKDKSMFIVEIKKILPDNQEEKILNSLESVNILLSRYFIGILIQLSIVFVLYFIVLLIFGVENSFIIAFLCAILNIIPYIGPLIGSILAAILTMICNLGSDFQTHILPTAIYVLIGFWIVQIIDNNICQPLIFSKSVKSHPLEIFLVILIAGFLFGIVGMIIAVPLFTILKVFGKEFLPENKIIQQLTKNI
ncbi:MAG: AI-2E family transporter [Flavobacterium sp.]|nr:AI-2E family transporter [Flavobacterium sp.]